MKVYPDQKMIRDEQQPHIRTLCNQTATGKVSLQRPCLWCKKEHHVMLKSLASSFERCERVYPDQHITRVQQPHIPYIMQSEGGIATTLWCENKIIVMLKSLAFSFGRCKKIVLTRPYECDRPGQKATPFCCTARPLRNATWNGPPNPYWYRSLHDLTREFPNAIRRAIHTNRNTAKATLSRGLSRTSCARTFLLLSRTWGKVGRE